MRVQFLLTYTVFGCVLPYMSVYFHDRQMSDVTIGYAFAIASAATLLAPVLVTLLADTHVDPRTLLAAALGLAGATLVGLSLSQLIPMLLLWYALHALAWAPILPLQDGILFGVQERAHGEGGRTPMPYHRVRVWGTIGFIVPSFGLFWLLRAGAAIEVVMMAGAACAVVAAVSARAFLPNPGPPERVDDAIARPAGETRLPTVQALRTLFGKPHVLVFCAATFLLGVASAPFYAFYPIYLTRKIGIDAQWIGMISNIGVAIEILFVLAFGRLRRLLGLKWLIVAGFLCTAARFALLAAFPNVFVAVGTQVFHGMMVLMFAVIPPSFLNEHAGSRFRHSMQGLYTMLVAGVARILGNLLAGPIAASSLITLFWFTAGVTTAAAVLVAVAFRQPVAAEAGAPHSSPNPLATEP